MRERTRARGRIIDASATLGPGAYRRELEERLSRVVREALGDTPPDVATSCGHPRDARYQGVTLAKIVEVYHEQTRRRGHRATRELVAGELHIGEATLQRYQKRLGHPGWPPVDHD